MVFSGWAYQLGWKVQLFPQDPDGSLAISTTKKKSAANVDCFDSSDSIAAHSPNSSI